MGGYVSAEKVRIWKAQAMLRDDQKYRELYAAAGDPATPAADLEEIFLTAHAVMGRDISEYVKIRALDIIKLLLANPNISTITMRQMIGYAPDILLDNPVLPLLLLAGEWGTMDYILVRKLRDQAFHSGHDLFPPLCAVCMPAWRYPYDATDRVICRDLACGICNPANHAGYMEVWKNNRSKGIDK